MSDNIGSEWALGGILGQLQGESEVRAARSLAKAVSRRFQQPQVVEIDMGALKQHLEEREAYINDLEGEIAELRRNRALLKANRDKISDWAIWAEKKLKSLGAL